MNDLPALPDTSADQAQNPAQPQRTSEPKRTPRKLAHVTRDWMQFKTIRSTTVNPHVAIDTSEEARSGVQTQMQRYFRAQIENFDQHRTASKRRRGAVASLLSFLKPGFVELWPQHMETRLKTLTEEKFGSADRDVRELIGDWLRVASRNLTCYIIWKRIFQAAALALLVALAWQFLTGPDTVLHPLVSRVDTLRGTAREGLDVLFFILFCGLLIGAFAGLNIYIFKREYNFALDKSSDVLSNCIKDRLSSLRIHYVECVGRLDECKTFGEDTGHVESGRETDADFAHGEGYFFMVLVQWLAKRIEYLQLHLYDELQTIQRKYAYRDFAGFVVWLLLFVAALYAVARLEGQGTGDVLYRGMITGFAVLGVCAISFLSYYWKSWNVGLTTLEENFDTTPKDWWTYDKLRLVDRI